MPRLTPFPAMPCRSAMFFLLGCALLIVSAHTVRAQEQPGGNGAIATYQKNRQAFIEEQKSASQTFKTQRTTKQQEIADLKNAIANQHEDLEAINAGIAGDQETIGILTGVQTAAACLLFPLLALYSMTLSALDSDYQMIALIGFLSLTVINVFLYLLFRQRLLFRRYRILLILFVIILIGAIASPLFANDQARREEVLSKLESAERMLSRSDYERFIAILEEQPRQYISLPSLQSGDPLFHVYEKVQVGTPEYWFTLAALYTHEGQNGKALDAVKRITQASGLRATAEHQHIISNCITYLIQAGQTQLAGTVVETLSKTIMDVPTLLQMAELLKQNGMQASAEKTLGFAIVKAENVADLVSLSTYFLDHSEPDKSNEALDKALGRVRTIDDVRLLAERAIALDKDVLIGNVIEKMNQVTDDYREKLAIVDLFLDHQRKEEAVNLISRLIRSDMAKTQANADRLLYLIDASLKRNLLPQATNATESLIFLLGINQAKSTVMGADYSLKSFSGLPDEDKIKLPQFYGLINEEQGFNDKAEEAYIQSVLESLSTIVNSYGYTFPESMNDFYLLGRIWLKGNRSDLIDQLDRVYTVIERQFLKKQTSLNDESLQGLQTEIDELKKQSAEALQAIEQARREHRDVQRRIFTQWLSTVGTVLFILSALIGCAVLSARYCRRLSMGKTFGFFIKFFETHGWLQVLSVLGAVTGFIAIVFSQFFIIFQRIQENTQPPVITDVPAPPPQAARNGSTADEPSSMLTGGQHA